MLYSSSAPICGLATDRASISSGRTSPGSSRTKIELLRRSRFGLPHALPELALDVVGDHQFELVGHIRPAQGRNLLAVDEPRGGRCFAGAGQRDADIGVLAFPRAVGDAPRY